MERGVVFQQYIHAAISFFKSFHGISQRQLDAVFAHFAVDHGSHIGVKGIHQLLGTLDNGHIHAQFPQIFCQFQSNETAACQHSRFWMVLIDIFLDPEGILYRTQGKQLIDTNTGKSGLGRLCAGREDQLIIAFLEHLIGFQILHGNGLALRVDGGDLMAHLHVHAETGEEALRCLECQFFRVSDDIADIVRQSAVGVGNISRTLKHNDLCLFIQSADSCCSCGTASHASYDHNFHVTVPPFRNKRQFRRYCLHWYRCLPEQQVLRSLPAGAGSIKTGYISS